MADAVDRSETLTQLGRAAQRCGRWYRLDMSFRSSLRADRRETDMSVLAGRLTVHEAVPMVARGDRAGNADATRYVICATLLDAGFHVHHSPSRTIPEHVSVTWPDGEWDENVALFFSRCFIDFMQVQSSCNE